MKHYLLTFLLCMSMAALGSTRFVILIASYNNQEFVRMNLESALNQDYENFSIIYCNDASTDCTLDRVKEVLAEHPCADRVVLRDNKQRCGALCNHYNAIHECCLDADVVIILDGDDALADAGVLRYLDGIYSNTEKRVWLTYGQYREIHSGALGFCSPMPMHIVRRNEFRKWPHLPSHLRSFKAWLFKRIAKEDLLYKGDFMMMSGDVATMIPMIEMARDHFLFISRVLCLYNDRNQLSNFRVDESFEKYLNGYIRSKPAYQPLVASPC